MIIDVNRVYGNLKTIYNNFTPSDKYYFLTYDFGNCEQYKAKSFVLNEIYDEVYGDLKPYCR